MSVVFVAGPLSGLIVQPVIGIISDGSTNRWGRRRPMLVIACLFCALSMLQLGFARPLARIFTAQDSSQTNGTIILVVMAIFAIDFSVNAISALDRALLLDLVDSKQQSLANAWSARLSGIGSIIGFFIGQADLTTIRPFSYFTSLSSSAQGQLDSIEAQLRCVCVLVVFLLISTHAITVLVVKEVPFLPLQSPATKHQSWCTLLSRSIRQAIADLCDAARNLSRPIWEIFRVQFFLWIAWFPVLFFSTSWISALTSDNSPGIESASAIRLGSLAMLYHAVLSIVCTIVFPQLLQYYNRRYPQTSMESLTSLWALSNLSLSTILLSTWVVEKIGSTNGAITLVAFTGFAWALTTWAPFALLGILIQKQTRRPNSNDLNLYSVGRRSRDSIFTRDDREEGAPFLGQGTNSEEREVEELDDVEGKADGSDDESDVGVVESRGSTGHGFHQSQERSTPRTASVRNQSGTILGLHNISIVTPQFLTTAMSTMIFSFVEPSPSLVGELSTGEAVQAARSGNQFGLILQLGGVSALAASILAFRLARNHSLALQG
ncbi:hypothetical protein CBS101457_003391 [Exobasidium rhododendri]|nr:hypothetical protein CBS101457_003391 [Exobasidium rhododendri]